MEREPNLVISSASQRVVEDGVPFKVDIYKREGGDGWVSGSRYRRRDVHCLG